MERWFAVATPGLEPVVARELSAYGISGEVTTGGVSFSADLEAGAELTTLLRSPARLLLRVAGSPVRSLQELARLVRAVGWRSFIPAGAEIDVVVSSRRSRLSRRDIVEKKVHTALKDALRGHRRKRNTAPPRMTQRLLVRLDGDQATLSLDAGGELLHRRGWRQEQVRAPLRENLAASILLASGWDGEEALLDPFCGSGTIPIEAALMASERPPWTHRGFAWEEWPALESVRPPRTRGEPIQAIIVGSDHDERSIGISQSNAERARIRGIRWTHRDVMDIEPPSSSGLVVANPPYGQRLGQRIRGVYVRFGQSLAERFVGWRAAFLSPNDRLARAVHPTAARLTTFSNGGLRVGLFIIEQV
ncbi:MAG: hypothetical protein AAFV53_37025 [Myxococcota bacterium]